MCSAGIHTGQGLESLAAWASRSPSVFGHSSSSWSGTSLGYVCNPSSSRKQDAVSRCYTFSIPASASFIPAGHNITSPLTSRPSIGQIILVFRAGHAEDIPLAFSDTVSRSLEERLGYVRNPRSLMEGTETLCRDDIGDLLGSPEHLWLRENANEIG